MVNIGFTDRGIDLPIIEQLPAIQGGAALDNEQAKGWYDKILGRWALVYKNISGIITAFTDGPKPKSYSWRSNPSIGQTAYLGGFYDAPTTDGFLNQAGPTLTYGTTNVAYGAHAFIVAAGAGTASGGSGLVEVVVEGTSVQDDGTITPSDSEIIVPSVVGVLTNNYFQTNKKWVGTITYKIQPAAGSTQTTYSFRFNYGLAAYDNFGNRDITIQDFEVNGLCGANDSNFDIRLFQHGSIGWVYSAAAFEPGTNILIAGFRDTYTTNNLIANGQPFRFKRTNLEYNLSSSLNDGYIIRIDTGNPNAVQSLDSHVVADYTF